MVQLLMKELFSREDGGGTVPPRWKGRVLGENDTEKGFAGFAALEHIAEFSDGKGPVQLSVMGCEEFDAGRIDGMRRSQMWDVLSVCQHHVISWTPWG